MRRYVERAGYETWAKTYPSRDRTIGELAEDLAGQIRDEVPRGPLVAVTHSLGGVIVRHMRDLLPWQGVCMLAPPNQGSRVAERLSRHDFFRWFLGPSGIELGKFESWPAPPEPFAVIAGTAGASLGNPPSWLIDGLEILPPDSPHDGTVAVAEAKLPGMAAFATVDASHTWIMNHPEVQRMVVEFIRRGTFDPPADPGEAADDAPATGGGAAR